MTFQSLRCPSCRESVPDDGAFCDQCGAPLVRCPQCGAVVADRFCPNDGTQVRAQANAAAHHAAPPTALSSSPTPAIAGSASAATLPVANVTVGSTNVQSRAPATTRAMPAPPATATPQSATGVPTQLTLVCVSHQIPPLLIRAGDVVGRQVDAVHREVLVAQKSVSRYHCRFERGNLGWTIVDVGSSSGSEIRRSPDWRPPEVAMKHQVPQPLAVGCYLRLGDLKFRVDAG